MFYHEPRIELPEVMKPLEIDVSSGRLQRPWRMISALFLAAALACGCQKNTRADQGIVPTDPQVAENLQMLSRELRRALPRLHRSTNFSDFAAVAGVDIPAPPAGQKYAISKNWKVILVEGK